VNWGVDETSRARFVTASGQPVVLAGGPVLPDSGLLARLEAPKSAKPIGLSVGRNIFEYPEFSCTRSGSR
jgi:DhnA family fructose-bisphosphate aldolase class Ia